MSFHPETLIIFAITIKLIFSFLYLAIICNSFGNRVYEYLNKTQIFTAKRIKWDIFSRYISASNVVMALTIGSFTCATLIPHPGYAIDVNDIAAGVRIGKLIEKAKKHFDKDDVKALIEDMLDLKNETENYTGQKLDLEKSIDQVFNDVQICRAK